jgi:O-antigen/teichoic acid export membrane protein
MSNNQNKNGLNGLFIYAGLQMFTVLSSLIRNKFIAHFTGAFGMGLYAMYNTPIGFLSILVNFGLPFSAIYEIASTIDKEKNEKKYDVIKALLLTLLSFGLFVLIVLLLFSKKINSYYFNNEVWYTLIFVGLIVIFNVLSDAFKSILQALRLKKILMLSTIFSLALSLLFSLPILILYNEVGILPSLIIGSFTTLVCMFFFAWKEIGLTKKTKKIELFIASKKLISAGFKFTIAQQIGALSKLILIVFLTKFSSIVFVGYYSVATGFTIGIFGVIINSLTTDYYPKMVLALKENIGSVNYLIQNHIRNSVIIILPMIIVFINCLNIIIELLLSKEFLFIVDFLKIASLGVFFQIINAPLGLIFLAAGKRNFTLLFEGITMNFLFLGLSIIGYFYNGLEGMAVFYNIYQIIYLILISLFLTHYFNLSLSNGIILECAFLSILLFGIIIFSIFCFSILGVQISWMFSFLGLFWCIYRFNEIYSLSKLIDRFK